MAGGKFSRVKTWSQNEVLKYNDLNAEFDNIIQNFQPDKMDSWSNTVSQMRIQTDPGSQGSESLATAFSGELERIRFAISRIIGKTYWYDTPTKSLQASAYSPTFYLPFDGKDKTEVWRNSISRGSIINAQTGNFGAGGGVALESWFSSTQAKFGLFSYQNNSVTGPDMPLCVAGLTHQRNKGTLSLWGYNLAASDHLAYNPQQGIELYFDNTGKLNAKITKPTATSSETAKDTAIITGSGSQVGAASWKNFIMKWQSNSIGGSNTDTLSLKLNGTNEGTQITASSIPMNVGDGGAWYFGGKRNDPSWVKFSAMKVVPSSEAVSPWSLNGTSSAATVSSGVLKIKTDGSGSVNGCYFSAGGSGLNGATYEWKLRHGTDWVTPEGYEFWATGAADVLNTPIAVKINDGTLSRSVGFFFHRGGIVVVDNNTTLGRYFSVAFDTSDWHVYRVTSSGTPNPTVKFFIDGVCVLGFTLTSADATATNISFGDHDTANTGNDAVSFWEWFAYAATSTPPVVNSVSGFLDEVVLIPDVTDSVTDTSLASNAATSVLSSDKPFHCYWQYVPQQMSVDVASSGAFTSTSTSLVAASPAQYVLPNDGLTPIQFIMSVNAQTNTGTGVVYVAFLDPVSVSINDGYTTINKDQLQYFATLYDKQTFATANDSKKMTAVNVRKTKLGYQGMQLFAASGNVAHTLSVDLRSIKISAIYLPRSS